MSSGWGKIDEAKEGSGIFLKIESGKSVQFAIVGEPHGYYQCYPDKREFLEPVPGASFRFKLNVAVLENGVFTMKILNQGITVGKTLRKFIQKLGPDQLFEVEREGSTKDNTVYHIIPLGKISPEQMSQIKALKPHPLASTAKDDKSDTSFNTNEYDAPHHAEGNY